MVRAYAYTVIDVSAPLRCFHPRCLATSQNVVSAFHEDPHTINSWYLRIGITVRVERKGKLKPLEKPFPVFWQGLRIVPTSRYPHHVVRSAAKNSVVTITIDAPAGTTGKLVLSKGWACEEGFVP